ncbi:hypothetical protein Y1Q_0004761 [Alligator mississippiensis]|uniref:ribonuclease H n=1 Tax=Alligator mississippiensis TaxID=8496 RepID=A0A151NLH8_ALLMI|nr:hypothetical protein Y1Q_0004761 [Alligator mississippiensis]
MLANPTPWRYQPIPTHTDLQPQIRNLLADLCKRGCIQPEKSSTYLSARWGIPKPGKPTEARLVVDYQQANRRCNPLQMPAAQTVTDILDGITEMKRSGEWFATTLDLKDMFYSIPINDPHGILNMCVGGQMFSWKYCSQGYRNAPALAATAMNGTIDSFVRPRPKTADVRIWTYVDDIVIMGHDCAVGRATTVDLKDHLSNQGWTVNPAKSMSEPSSGIKFLGTRFTGQW